MTACEQQALAGLGAKRFGFWNVHKSCFAAVVLQLLLRVPGFPALIHSAADAAVAVEGSSWSLAKALKVGSMD